MNLSYWEQKSWFGDIDFAIVGSGIVGLSCALALRKKHPKKKIVVFEKGILPSGASTKNAGFACFGSVSEILEDLKTHSEEEVIQIIRGRIEGLKLLRETLGDHEIDYHEYGGYEVFSAADEQLYEKCLSNLPYVNNLMKMAFYAEKGVFIVKNDPFSFKNTQKKLIFNQFEGQINTGMMMQALLKKAAEMDIFVINSVEIESYLPKNGAISIILNKNVEISVKKLLLATNGFAKQLFKEELQPARAQVLITKPIKDLKIKGTFHLEKGYYYFRNIDDRILLGGGRNLDFNAEETTELGLTALVQNKLDELLSTTILPGTAFEIESRWSGIMGVGGKKKPIVKKIDDHVYCGVRLGGMGVAIGSSIGKHMAELVDS